MGKTNFDNYISSQIKKEPGLKNDLVKAGVAIDISMQIYKLRKEKGMTQKELAEVTGVQQSNIARLENADYDGYSMRTLNKIAKALDTELKVQLISDESSSREKVIIHYIIPYIGIPVNKDINIINSKITKSIKKSEKIMSYLYQ